MNSDFQILLVVRADKHPVHLPSGDSDPPIPAPWWPDGPVTACIDHEDGLDLVGWIVFDKEDDTNLFNAGELESVLKMWCVQYGREWRFETYCPATREAFKVPPPVKAKRRRR